MIHVPWPTVSPGWLKITLSPSGVYGRITLSEDGTSFSSTLTGTILDQVEKARAILLMWGKVGNKHHRGIEVEPGAAT